MGWEPTQRFGGEAEMSISLRRGTPADAAILGGICYTAFKAIAEARGCRGIRLLQAGYHNRTLALYMKLGFEAREQLACAQGPAVGKVVAGHSVWPAEERDLAACNRLCLQVHGHERGGELADAVAQGTARVAETAGRITRYTTCVAFFGHAVGESNDDLKALIGAAENFPGPGFLVPTRNGDLMRWCLAEGLRIMQTMTLMTIGFYKEPSGSWCPPLPFKVCIS
jgi:hypothetical protein